MQLKVQLPKEFFEETTATFVIDQERKRLWAALLDLLNEFHRVCTCHNIKYSLDAGTLLGKVRHNGIIPWDDDVDVLMLRSEFEKLKQVASKFQPPYFLQTTESDPQAYNTFPKLRNSVTTMITNSAMKDGKAILKNYNQGVFMDIFIFDAVPNDVSERVPFFQELAKLRKQVLMAGNWKERKPKPSFSLRGFLNYRHEMKEWKKYENILKTTGQDPLIVYKQQFEKACRRYENVQTREVSHLTFAPNPPAKWIFERDKVTEVEEVEFMGIKVMMLKEWKYYLDHLYGNWHKYVVGASDHGTLFVDLERPYTDYF